ncbi:MAG: hypothetical protein OXD47_09780 [Gammaproteobacteria bacterium]|nr:hypothetical protein [Gammaproteobacteria bacterium]
MISPQAAQGAALLAFLLALSVASGWLLLSDLNRQAQVYTRRVSSALTLHRAKQALLSYAMNYPDLRANPEKGPGFLPCPDRNNDGRPESNCAAGTGTILGRLPFAILGLDDPRDSSGARLWYAVSPDFRNTRSNHAVINSETPGQFTLDGADDVVAVVMAPGVPVGAQVARPSNAPTDYLEGENASVADGRFSTLAGNDQVVAISRAELMQALELRVTNEVRALLARYRSAHGAYPWLAAFAHPHLDGRVLRGSHNGSDNAEALTDTRRDFLDWGVRAYDLLRNVTDGSLAVVKTVSKNRLELSAPSAGAENDFDRGDVYFIELRGPGRAVSGTATGGSSGLLLKDTGQDFREVGVAPGDVVENLTEGSRATVAGVGRTTLRLRRSAASAGNGFDSGATYRLLVNTGSAGPGSANLTLADPTADFISAGVGVGDLVENLSDGSTGRVSQVAGPGLLRVAALHFGRNNRFDEYDVYRLPRYNAADNTRQGLLPVHEPGKRFATGFGVTWEAPAGGGWIITGLHPTVHPGYAAAVTRALRAAAPAGVVNVANGYCVWLNVQVVDCVGSSASVPLLAGHASAGSSAGVLTDSAADFINAGVTPGALVEAPYNSVVTRVASATTLHLLRLPTAARLLASGARYHIRSATRLLTGNTDRADPARLHDPHQDFHAAGVRTGDLLANLTDGSFGLITAVSGASVSAELQGGQRNAYRPGDAYRIFHAYVNRRRYRFSLRYQGERVMRASNGLRQRDVCRGYGDDCAGVAVTTRLPFQAQGLAGAATVGAAGLMLAAAQADFLHAGILPGDTLFNLDDGSAGMVQAVARRALTVDAWHGGHANNPVPGNRYRIGRPLLIIEDLLDDSAVTRIGLTAPPGGAAGAVRTTGINYHLAETPGELPPWFIKNKWHRLVYVAYGAGFAPGGSGHCHAGVDCLVIRDHADDTQALVLAAGLALPQQQRTHGAGAAYYEAENANADADEVFAGGLPDDTFNDRLVVVAP